LALKEFIDQLASAGLFPIQIEATVSRGESDGRVFVGGLDEFIKAAKVLKSDVVFVSRWVLEVDDFKYDPSEVEDADQVGEEEDDAENTSDDRQIDLAAVLPALEKFKQHIGESCAYKFSLLLPPDGLDLFIEEPWWSEFLDLHEDAVARVEEDLESITERQREERDAKNEVFLGRLRELVHDTDFVRLPTQKAMLAYALDKMPELEAIDLTTLQAEIQNLNAKIAAKRLSRKR
jgi:hypothetical protein